MGCFHSLEEAKAFFEQDRFAVTNGIEITTLEEDGCVCTMTVRDDHRNALGGIMGGVLFTLGDFASAVASNNDHRPTVALDSSIHFLSSSKGSTLTAVAKRIKSGKTTSVYQVSIRDEYEKEIALFTGTGYKLLPAGKEE